MAFPILPSELQAIHDSTAIFCQTAIDDRKYDEAFRGFEDLYHSMLDWQKTRGERYHKGFPLHNMGYVSYLQRREPGETIRYFILAHIEDLLSEGGRRGSRRRHACGAKS